jgi:predicted molibdopterin-dependent oxidoreductase YjgC
VLPLADRARFVLSSSMFMTAVTGQSHVILPGTSYLERDGTTVNLEGRPQRQRRAVSRTTPHELEFFARLAQRFGVDVSPWPRVEADERASLPPRGDAGAVTAPRVSPPAQPNGDGLRLLPYRPLFAGAAVERVPQLAFQRPLAEIELSAFDARKHGAWTGDAVRVASNGTARTLTVKVNRRLMEGVARIAADHAANLGETIEVTREP